MNNIKLILFNHYAYGAIGDWMYRTIAGMTQDEPGYKQIAIVPKPAGGLTDGIRRTQNALRKTAFTVETGWKNNGAEVQVPNNTAKLVLPGLASATVTESGTAVSKIKTYHNYFCVRQGC